MSAHSSGTRVPASSIALFAGAVLVPLFLFVVAASVDRRDVVKHAVGNAERTAMALREHATKVLDTNQIAFERILDRIKNRSWEELHAERAQLHVFLKQIQASLPQVSNIIVVDAEGRVQIEANHARAGGELSVADRDYFTEQRASPGDNAVLGKTIRGRFGGRTIFGVSRKLTGPNGEFSGVVFMGMLPSYFAQFWRNFAAGDDQLIGLIRADGEVLAMYPDAPIESMRLLPNGPVGAAVRDGHEGVFLGALKLDGVDRIFAIRRLDHNPVYILYGHSTASVRQSWMQSVMYYGAAALVASALLFAVAWFALRHLRGEQEAVAALRAETQRRREAEASLLHAQKLEAVGELTGGLAHDLGNFVQAITGCLRGLKGKQIDDRQEQRVGLAMDVVDRMSKSLRQLLAFARKQPLEPTVLNLNETIQSALPLVSQAVGGGVSLETILTGDGWETEIDKSQFEVAILNLSVNARDAMPDGGRLRIETRNVRFEPDCGPEGLSGEFAAVLVSDTGIGMSPEVRARAFEPFFTTKESGKGTGLGLAAVYGFAKQLGGAAAIDSEQGKGTTVTLYFPRWTGAPESVRSDPHDMLSGNVVRLVHPGNRVANG